MPGDRGYPLLGMAVGVGGLIHLAGDMITRHGSPIFWPIPTGRRLWLAVHHDLSPLLAVRRSNLVAKLALELLHTGPHAPELVLEP